MLSRSTGAHAARLHRGIRSLPAPAPRRLYSVPAPGLPQPEKQPPTLPLPPSKKPKLDLRPAPIKPKPVPGNGKPPPAASPAPKPAPHVPTLPSLGAAKEEAKHDIRDAEAHGILTPPPPGAPWLKKTLHQVIQIAKFYYRGTKLIFTRRKAIALITARVRAGGAPLTRAEFRLIATQKDDVTKLVPFLIIALLLEEVIPLIAIYAPFMLPSTCILPAQRERIEAKRAEKARAFAALYAPVFSQLAAEAAAASRHLPPAALRRADAPIAVCGSLGLSTIGIDALRIHRIRRHLDFIARDDQMLLTDSAALSRRELADALEERGIRTAPTMAYKEMQVRLLGWLDAVRDASTPAVDPAAALARRLALVVEHAAHSQS